MVSSSSVAAQASESEKRKKQTMEKVKVNHLSRQLQMRLQYARLKVEHGWQKQNLNEVENLYFHNSHLRVSKSYPVPRIVTTQPQPPLFPAPPLNFAQSRLSFRYGPTVSRTSSGILSTEGSFSQISQADSNSNEAAAIIDSPVSATNKDSSATINAPDAALDAMVVSSPEGTPSLPVASTSISISANENTTMVLDDHTVAAADPIATPQDGQSSTDASQPSNNHYLSTRPVRPRTTKVSSSSRGLPSLTARDMYNFGSTSSLTYDSFWSSHSGSTTPRPGRSNPLQASNSGDFTSSIQDHSRPTSAYASSTTISSPSMHLEIPRNPGGPP